MKITKTVQFDCAHMLSDYVGKCGNLHGHTYKVQVTLEAPLVEEKRSPINSMVMDFVDLKDFINKAFLEKMDHAVIFSAKEYRNEAEEALLQWAEKFNMRHVVIKGRTTAETFATVFRENLQHTLSSYFFVDDYFTISVRVWETPTSYAEV